MPNVTTPATEISVATMLVASLLSLALVGPSTAARAAEPLAFTIPAEDGYGIADCLQAGSACGSPLADSFCEAHGHLKSIAFGTAADVTGATPGTAGVALTPGDVLIRCRD